MIRALFHTRNAIAFLRLHVAQTFLNCAYDRLSVLVVDDQLLNGIARHG